MHIFSLVTAFFPNAYEYNFLYSIYFKEFSFLSCFTISLMVSTSHSATLIQTLVLLLSSTLEHGSGFQGA
jgi:hypothetical protein